MQNYTGIHAHLTHPVFHAAVSTQIRAPTPISVIRRTSDSASPYRPVCTVHTSSSNHLLHFLGLLHQLAFTSPLRSLGSGLGVHYVIPPSEAAGIIADELFVVDI